MIGIPGYVCPSEITERITSGTVTFKGEPLANGTVRFNPTNPQKGRPVEGMIESGGRFKPGFSYGNTDDFGYAAVENVVTVHDLHATLLSALGLDHQRLTYPHDGRPGSLTDVAITKAKVIADLLHSPQV